MAEETKNYLLEEDNETSGFDYKAFFSQTPDVLALDCGVRGSSLDWCLFLPQDPDPSLHRQFLRPDQERKVREEPTEPIWKTLGICIHL